jgi:hypothetical protein
MRESVHHQVRHSEISVNHAISKKLATSHHELPHGADVMMESNAGLVLGRPMQALLETTV